MHSRLAILPASDLGLQQPDQVLIAGQGDLQIKQPLLQSRE